MRFCLQEILNITASKLEDIIKPLNDDEYGLLDKHKYADTGSPDSTEEMKNLESRQAAVTLLQIKNYDPNKYAVKTEEDHHIVFSSAPSLPPAERAREVMHCNAVIDIISKAVAVAQRENEDSHKYPPSYTTVIERSNPSELGYSHEYQDDQYNSAYGVAQNAPSPGSHEDQENKEMDLSLYSVKSEPHEQCEPEERDRSNSYFHKALSHNKQSNFVDEYKQHVFGRSGSKKARDNSSVYEECSQSSSGSDPDRLQMDISQMSQVRTQNVYRSR